MDLHEFYDRNSTLFIEYNNGIRKLCDDVRRDFIIPFCRKHNLEFETNAPTPQRYRFRNLVHKKINIREFLDGYGEWISDSVAPETVLEGSAELRKILETKTLYCDVSFGSIRCVHTGEICAAYDPLTE